jgi:predicted thioesterase
MSALEPGLVGEAERMVTEELTAARLGSGSLAVLGTPALIAVMEEAAVRALVGHLGPGQTSVGVRIDVRHLAATPLGMKVRARAELLAVDGRRLVFRVEAWEGDKLIGAAYHERIVVDEARFLRRVEGKTA